ncbi:MAG: hypothetical protein OXL98_12340 [Acidimicrobiaceae bacterium]|nr:hypothetical protein [Acidimicrobiaceae bacterium]
MSSKWSEGIEPRRFRWIITGRFGVCERPGGYGVGHRRVRRIEEVIWLSRNEIGLIVSITSIPYNLRDYEEHGLAYAHLPFSEPGDGAERLEQILATIRDHSTDQRVVLHHDSIGDRVSGVVAGYLLWSGLVDTGPEAVTIAERLLERELGPMAREIVSMAQQLRSAP